MVYHPVLWVSSEQVVDLFNQMDNYFPVVFQKRKGDLYLVSGVDLELKLYRIFSHSAFLPHSQSLVLEHLLSSQQDSQVAGHILFQQIVKQQGHSVFGDRSIQDIWNHLNNSMADQDSLEVTLAMSESLFTLVKSLLFRNGTVSMATLVTRILDRVIEVAMENKDAMVLLERLTEVSPSVFQHILDQVGLMCV